jgi:LemA protein
MIALWIIIGIVGIIVLWLIATYNRLVTLQNRVEEAWADIDVQLKRRYDLIPNLVNTVKGYAAHEAQTLEKVIEARNQAMSSEEGGNRQEIAAAENMLSGTLKSLFALSENYPDLKANTNFLELQKELSDTENKIQAARRFFNSNVKEINTQIEMFPTNLIARSFGFSEKEFFSLDEAPESRENIAVQF